MDNFSVILRADVIIGPKDPVAYCCHPFTPFRAGSERSPDVIIRTDERIPWGLSVIARSSAFFTKNAERRGNPVII